jgi:hypothetical protein
MTDDRKPARLPEKLVRELAREAGVSEEDIRQIVALVGFDRASILREARLLKKDV